jgi:hypothetical protein
MENPEMLETLVTPDTGLLDCRSVLSNVYLLHVPIVCPVSCVINVSSISGFSILDCRSVLFIDNPEILEALITQDTGQTIGSK